MGAKGFNGRALTEGRRVMYSGLSITFVPTYYVTNRAVGPGVELTVDYGAGLVSPLLM
jgi:hypothetical protein